MIDESDFEQKLRMRFPDGPDKGNSAIGVSREMVATAVKMLAEEYRNADIDLVVAVEKDQSDIDIRGLIICVRGDYTATTPMVVSPQLVRFNNREVFLAHRNGSTNLARALFAAVDAAVEGANASAMI